MSACEEAASIPLSISRNQSPYSLCWYSVPEVSKVRNEIIIMKKFL
jgi:hypothetical protein